jgi:hypothetical protein
MKNMLKNVTTDTIQKVPKSQYLFFAIKGMMLRNKTMERILLLPGLKPRVVWSGKIQSLNYINL